MYYILIDSGTTNSRARLVDEKLRVLDVKKVQIGVKQTAIDGNNEKLKSVIKELITEILEKNNISRDEIINVVASGMITSELGLCEINHIEVPVDKNKLKENIVKIRYEEFLDLEFIFIPGVKNKLEPDDNFQYMDIMRGEEVEAIGLIEHLNLNDRGLIIIPGSHTKYIEINENKEIISSFSTLAGEVIDAIRNNTILSNILGGDLEYKVNKEFILKGYDSTCKYGLTRSFYNVRLMDMFTESSKEEKINYYMGAIMYDDIKAIEKLVNLDEIKWIVISGNNSLKEIFEMLLKDKFSDIQIDTVNSLDIENSLVKGAISIIG